jgi:hypothetical protein
MEPAAEALGAASALIQGMAANVAATAVEVSDVPQKLRRFIEFPSFQSSRLASTWPD